MARQLRLEHAGAIWHLMSRGNERRPIFITDRDRRLFLKTLAEVIDLNFWILHGWVLMANHYHLVVETPVPTLSRGMKRLNEVYAGYFNSVHDRVGHLFQGRFKGVLVERESHLLELCRYVVLNPVRAGLVSDPADHRWSNYSATAGLETSPDWLDVDSTLLNFPANTRADSQRRYMEFVADARGLSYDPRDHTLNQIFLGGKKFCARMQRMIDATERSPEIPRPQRQAWLPDFSMAVAIIAEVFGETEQSIRPRSHRSSRKAVAHVCWENCAITLAEIGRYLNVTPQAASHLMKRSRELATRSNSYEEKLRQIRMRLVSLDPPD